jgi:hypothetical protein
MYGKLDAFEWVGELMKFSFEYQFKSLLSPDTYLLKVFWVLSFEVFYVNLKKPLFFILIQFTRGQPLFVPYDRPKLKKKRMNV